MLHNNNKIMHSVGHNSRLFYYFKCWQLVSVWIGHHQTNIYKNLKKSGAHNLTYQYHGIPFYGFINIGLMMAYFSCQQTDPEPCHCDIFPPDGTPGWLQCLFRWLHSLWLPSLSMSPMTLTEQCEMQLHDRYCLVVSLVLYSHVILVYWQLYQPSDNQADW
jgi:hypothetical protein